MSKRSAPSDPSVVDKARSKRKVDSSVSHSDGSSNPCEESDFNLMAPLPLTYAPAAPTFIGPASTVVDDDLTEWRRRYSLPSHIVLRAPASEEMASSCTPGEITVYEAFFDSGFRGVIPAFIVNLCGLFEIYPFQLNPPAWRILIAIQNLGEGRFHLRPCSGLPIVEEFPKNDLKGPAWGADRSLVLNRFSSDHYILSAAGTHPAPAEGENTVLRARQLPLDRRQVNFLISETVLLRSSLWSKCVSSHFLHLFLVSDGSFLTRNMFGSAINNPFAAYQEAEKMMSAKKGSASRTTSGDEVIITGSRHATMVKPEPTSSSQKKRSRGGGVKTMSAHQSADGVVLPAGDPSEVVQVLQGGLLQVTSQLYHLKERLSNENLVIDREELESLKRQVSEEREQRTARELEICDLKDKVRELEEVAETSSAEALAASQKSQELEWLNKQSGQWDLNRALDQYKMVILEEAKNKGDPPPSFEDEPAISSASEIDVDSSVKP
ncbi:hypothetical protein HID58_013473 [Brassica napus]|uniref:Uncharacterized protein n=1 Tax=Brassica napus TaxID=3708 RepID=A0ABQ8E403_BRANA|nr:hypothetical protein HID58_013473 [Brassica napus]